MNDRIHRALDAELDHRELSQTESLELERTRSLLDGVLNAIPSGRSISMRYAVLDRIESAERERNDTSGRETSGVLSWLLRTRNVSFAVRPAYAIGLAAILAVVIGVGTLRNDARTAAIVSPSEVLVHFRLEAPQATSVALAGDFTNWNPAYAMKRSEPGVWTIVVPLTPGVHDYSFIVDGEKWVPDPAAPARADGFGGMNSRIAVIASDSRRSL